MMLMHCGRFIEKAHKIVGESDVYLIDICTTDFNRLVNKDIYRNKK